MPVQKPPTKFKAIVPFLTRAHQLDKTDPIIAYWCYYWAVQIILSGNLHAGDAECTNYTTSLLDDLEARKEKLLPNDVITDDMAAQAYVENFALRVFNNADNALQARKASRQTADNFLAAATFLELCKIFPNVDPEIISKIKFAKYQAARIIKAFQAGADPNLPAKTEEDVADQNTENKGISRISMHPFVEDVQDEDLPRTAIQHPTPPMIVRAHPPLSASPPTPPQRMSPISQSSATSDRFPLHHHPPPLPEQDYFPTIPIGRSFSPLSPNRTCTNTPQDVLSPFHQPGRAEPPQHPPPADTIRTSFDDDTHVRLQNHHTTAPLPTQFPPQHFDQSSALHIRPSYPSPAPLPSFTPSFPPTSAPVADTPSVYYSTPSAPPASSPLHHFQTAPQPYHPPQPPPPAIPAFPDDESITKAQKHAKWAISALNYDDITTAVKELRLALKTLGAS